MQEIIKYVVFQTQTSWTSIRPSTSAGNLMSLPGQHLLLLPRSVYNSPAFPQNLLPGFPHLQSPQQAPHQQPPAPQAQQHASHPQQQQLLETQLGK
jgi:hypothetical protein